MKFMNDSFVDYRGVPSTPGGQDSYFPIALFLDWLDTRQSSRRGCSLDIRIAIAREEFFGPQLVVIPFEDDEDAIRIVIDSAMTCLAALTAKLVKGFTNEN
jgi:hypothetical protein